MKEQAKKVPAVHAETSGSGKKLVQARLPFKIISSPVAGPKVATPINESRKRKLSSEGDVAGPRKVICTSEIKENLRDCKNEPVVVLSDDEPVEPAETGETSPNSMNPVVKLNKIDDLIKDLADEHGRITLSPKTPKVLREFDRYRRPDSPISSKVPTTGTKLLIKLPISEKKKRKLSQKFSSSFESDSDLELVSEELNPGKKARPLAGQKEALNTVSLVEENRNDEESKDSLPDPAEKCSLEQKTCDAKQSESISSVCTKMPCQNVCDESPDQQELTEKSSQKDKALGEKKSNDISPVSTEHSSQNDSKAADCQQNDYAKESDKLEVSIIITDDEDSVQPDSDEEINTEDASKPVESSTEDPQSEDESVVIDDDSDADISSTKSSQPGKSENEFVKCETPSKTSEGSENLQSKVLTPKQRKLIEMRQEKQKQKEAERLAKQKEKEEKLRSRQKEKEEKEELKRKEKEEKDEQKRKEREEKEEQKRKEKEEKEKKRLAELEAKSEERRQKEEEKRLKEEERRKKEEEKKKKEEEAENKKRRAAEAFSKFFVPSKGSQKDPENDENFTDGARVQNSKFVPFQVKRDMKLAPICRKCLDDASKRNLDEVLQREDGEALAEDLYLSCLKTGKICPGRDTRTLSACSLEEDSSADCVIIDELEGAGLEIDEANKSVQKYRAKFLYFHENQRPPYYGTWRKKSDSVKPRRPFAQDKRLFDYEVNSDDEWEEEDPGESLHGSDDEKESEDEYDVDNEFMVPHGHLSDEELQNEDELEDNSPEMQKEKLKILQAEFAQEMKKKTQKIKPRIVGIVWQDENGNRPDLCSSGMWESLNKRAMIFTTPPILKAPEKPERESVTPEKKQVSKTAKLNEEHIKTLVQLVHGNRHKKEFMIKEFQAFVSKETPETEEPLQFTKSSIREQIERIAAWKVVVMDETKKKKRLCWMVAPDILKQYDLEALGVVNKWQYTLQPKRILEEPENTETVPPTESEVSTAEKADSKTLKRKKKKKPHPAITMFTTVVSKEVGNSKNPLNATNSSGSQFENNKEESALKPLQLKKKSEEVLKPIPDNTHTSTKSPIAFNKPSSTPPAQKKRVALLMSVPRGQKIPQEKKIDLISKFLKKQPETEKGSSKEALVATSTNMPVSSSKPSTTSPDQTTPPQKKRVAILLSVPRGQAIPQEKKSELISELLKKRPETDKDPPGAKGTSVPTPMEVETITLD